MKEGNRGKIKEDVNVGKRWKREEVRQGGKNCVGERGREGGRERGSEGGTQTYVQVGYSISYQFVSFTSGIYSFILYPQYLYRNIIYIYQA